MLIIILSFLAAVHHPSFSWLQANFQASNALCARIPPPAGFTRIPPPEGSFAWWLQHLPLKEGRPPVHLYNGKLKGNQEAHVAVMDIDAGSRDLQQCADAVIRLRAEYLFSVGRFDDIAFHFTNGDSASWVRWREGWRPVVNGSSVGWEKRTPEDSSYHNFRKYMDSVFMYAGSMSLSRELKKVRDPKDIQIGDIFIQGGSPGHAEIVVDMAANWKGEKIFLLAQSYMPAQEIHILKNPNDPALSPWYRADPGELITPEWTFPAGSLRRFRDEPR
jgi:hypothetical protein